MQNYYVLVSSLLFITVFILIVRIFNKLKKQQKSKVLLELESEVNDLILEMNQTTDRNINILEEKIRALSKILNDADKRIKILGTETGKIKAETTVYSRAGLIDEKKLDSDVPLKKKQAVETNKRDRIIELHNNGFTSSVIASRVGLTVGEIELIISLVEGR
jgi:hypothetical protein